MYNNATSASLWCVGVPVVEIEIALTRAIRLFLQSCGLSSGDRHETYPGVATSHFRLSNPSRYCNYIPIPVTGTPTYHKRNITNHDILSQMSLFVIRTTTTLRCCRRGSPNFRQSGGAIDRASDLAGDTAGDRRRRTKVAIKLPSEQTIDRRSAARYTQPFTETHTKTDDKPTNHQQRHENPENTTKKIRKTMKKRNTSKHTRKKPNKA